MSITGRLSAVYTITIGRDSGLDSAEGWQPVERHYTRTGRMFRPVRIITNWKWQTGAKSWDHGDTTISGPTTRADGSDGAALLNNYYGVEQLPEWAQNLVTIAATRLPDLGDVK